MIEGLAPLFFYRTLMIDRTLIETLIANATEGTPCFLVELKIGKGNEIKVEIDSDEGVSIEDCMMVSRGIEHNLDREEEDFSLKVTSPGADQPLRVWRQYKAHLGRTLKIETTDGEQLKGELIAVNEEDLVIMTAPKKVKKGKKKEQIDSEEIQLKKDEIKSATVVLSFK